MLKIAIETECHPLHTPFRISRGAKTTADVIVLRLSGNGKTGVGECVPYARYGETLESVSQQIEGVAGNIKADISLAEIQGLLPAGAGRHALDAAYRDLHSDRPALPSSLRTAMTVPIDTPENMAKTAKAHPSSILKIKLGGPEDVDGLKAVASATPDKDIIVDANEGWDIDGLKDIMDTLLRCRVRMIEQPLHKNRDEALADFLSPIPIYADESVHTADDLECLKGKYEGVNIKLDKTGGLTHALTLKDRALDMGFDVMAGCMVCTSRSIRQALPLVDDTLSWIDLDGAYWLYEDISPIIDYESWVQGSGFSTMPI